MFYHRSAQQKRSQVSMHRRRGTPPLGAVAVDSVQTLGARLEPECPGLEDRVPSERTAEARICLRSRGATNLRQARLKT